METWEACYTSMIAATFAWHVLDASTLSVLDCADTYSATNVGKMLHMLLKSRPETSDKQISRTFTNMAAELAVTL
jgi:hypothetical protein